MQNFWYLHIREPIRHLFCVKNIDWRGSNGPLGKKKCNLDSKILIIGTRIGCVIFQIVDLVKAVNAWDRGAFCSFYLSFLALLSANDDAKG